VVAAVCAIVRVWITNNPTTPHASFIFSPLLARDDLAPDDAAADAIRSALEWLMRQLPGPYTADTARVLGALLKRREAPAAVVLATLERWVAQHGLCPDAVYVYKATFMNNKSIPPSALDPAVEWLEGAGENAEVDRVADFLLTLCELPDPDW
jgi:hypothetical protein